MVRATVGGSEGRQQTDLARGPCPLGGQESLGLIAPPAPPKHGPKEGLVCPPGQRAGAQTALSPQSSSMAWSGTT